MLVPHRRLRLCRSVSAAGSEAEAESGAESDDESSADEARSPSPSPVSKPSHPKKKLKVVDVAAEEDDDEATDDDEVKKPAVPKRKRLSKTAKEDAEDEEELKREKKRAVTLGYDASDGFLAMDVKEKGRVRVLKKVAKEKELDAMLSDMDTEAHLDHLEELATAQSSSGTKRKRDSDAEDIDDGDDVEEDDPETKDKPDKYKHPRLGKAKGGKINYSPVTLTTPKPTKFKSRMVVHGVDAVPYAKPVVMQTPYWSTAHKKLDKDRKNVPLRPEDLTHVGLFVDNKFKGITTVAISKPREDVKPMVVSIPLLELRKVTKLLMSNNKLSFDTIRAKNNFHEVDGDLVPMIPPVVYNEMLHDEQTKPSKREVPDPVAAEDKKAHSLEEEERKQIARLRADLESVITPEQAKNFRGFVVEAGQAIVGRVKDPSKTAKEAIESFSAITKRMDKRQDFVEVMKALGEWNTGRGKELVPWLRGFITMASLYEPILHYNLGLAVKRRQDELKPKKPEKNKDSEDYF